MSSTFSNKFLYDDEGITTPTSTSEINTERTISYFVYHKLKLFKKEHFRFIKKMYKNRTSAGRKAETFSVWNPAYFLFPLIVLDYEDKDELNVYIDECIGYLKNRIGKEGVFSGFYYDNPHVVTNYSVLIAIALMGKEEGYNLVNRQKTYNFLMSLKLSNGAFMTSRDMEYDLRSTFAAMVIANEYNILTPELKEGVVEFVLSCMNVDGGFSPRPGLESHGGYVHSAIGILNILNRLDDVDLNAVIRWIADRQMEFSGGFQGRPNKLVDSCYSWWIGSACKIISEHLNISPFWNEEAMTDYIVRSSQDLSGGFRDHQPTGPNYFHTLYGLAGLCISGLRSFGEGEDHIELPVLDNMICCPKTLVEKMHKYFYSKPFVVV